MKTNRILALAPAILLSAPLAAQMQGGSVVRASEFALTDMLQLSQYDYSLGTARSAAMGGAFSSLGADMSSLSMNPAGLGMYRGSEFSISPALSWTKTDASSPGAYRKGMDNGRTTFSPGSVGFALNMFQSTGSPISATFGFGYTRLADFNRRSSIMLGGLDRSILDVMATNLTSQGVLLGGIKHNPWGVDDYSGWEGLQPSEWGGALGYWSFAVDPAAPDDDDNGVYYAALNNDALTDNGIQENVRGSVGEYSIAGGINANNKLYVGFSLGIQSLMYRREIFYTEEYRQSYNEQSPMVDYLEYDQYHRYEGVGVNFKAGLIYRPVEALRIGLALHTPTVVTLESTYHARMYTISQNGNPNEEETAVLSSTYNYASPTRIMAGLSYQFSGVAILSADYERVWYNGIRLVDGETNPVPQDVRSGYKADVKYSFKGQDNLRVGLEVRPVPQVALRGGYAWSGSPIKEGVPLAYTGRKPVPATLHAPVARTSSCYSLGLGYRTGGFSIDAAYIFTDIKNTDHNMYWWDDANPDQNIGGSIVNSTMKRNIATVTAGFRF